MEYLVRRAKTSPQQGVAVVEAALVLLLLLMLLLAIMEGGRLLNVTNVITDAAREGARFAVTPLSRTSSLPAAQDIQNQVKSYLQSSYVQGATITIERPVRIQTGTVQTEYTRVRVQVPYRVITLSMFSPLQVTLSAEALMRNETSP